MTDALQKAIAELEKVTGDDMETRAFRLARRRAIDNLAAMAPEIAALGDAHGGDAVVLYWAHYLSSMLCATVRNVGAEDMQTVIEAAAEFAASKAPYLSKDRPT